VEEGTKIIGLFFGLLAMLFFAFADLLIYFLFGTMYSESILVMRTYSLWLFFLSLQIFFNSLLLAINKLISGTLVLFGFCIMNFILNILLIPKLGAFGAALSSVIAFFITLFGIFYVYDKYNVKVFEKVKLLIAGIILSVLIGILVTEYLAPVVFLIFVILTKQITMDDINKYASIFLKNDTLT